MRRITLLLAIFVLIIAQIHALTMQVEPRTTECFLYKASRGETLDFEFIVTRGGLLDVNLRISSPGGKILHEALHFFQEGEESIQTITADEAGAYSFCFDNEMSRWTAKVVKFELNVLSDSPASDIVSGGTPLPTPTDCS